MILKCRKKDIYQKHNMKREFDFSSPPLYNLVRKVVGNEVPIAISQLKIY